MRLRVFPRQSGFTYLWLLFALAFASYGLMSLGEHWVLQSQRELEREQMFRGQEIVAALKSYAATTPAGTHCAPRSLEELLQDARLPGIQRHLRRIYSDPLTGLPDWELLRDALGGVVGVRSRSARVLVSGLSRKALPANRVGRVFQVVEGPGGVSLCAPMAGAVNLPSTPVSGSTAGVAQ